MKHITVAIFFLFSISSHSENLNKISQVEKLLEVMNSDSVIDNMYSQMDTMMDSVKLQYDIQPSEQAVYDTYNAKIIALLKSEMSWDKIKDPMIKIYAQHLTEKEIQDMIIFYSSETGQSMVKKLPLILGDSMKISQDLMMDVIPKMQKISEELYKDLSDMRNK